MERLCPAGSCSCAPDAALAPNTSCLFGNQVLQFTDVSQPETVLSVPIAIPAANRQYTATITPAQGPSDDNGTAPTLSVVDATTGAVLATGTSRNTGSGISAVVSFTPTTTDSVRLEITVAPVPGYPTVSMAVYAATLTYSQDYGVFAGWPDSLPSQLQTAAVINACYATGYAGGSPANDVIENGSIVQGQGLGYNSYPIHIVDVTGITINNVQTLSTGLDTGAVNGNWSQNIVITNSTFRSTVNNVTDRMSMIGSLVTLSRQQGSVDFENNTLLGSPQIGIYVSMDNTAGTLAIRGNTIQSNAVVTDGYGILLDGVDNFEVSGNTITEPDGMSGRGILLDGTADGGNSSSNNGQVFDNYVEHPRDTEPRVRRGWFGGHRLAQSGPI